MMNDLTSFETIDWELEARRVARAFGLEGECEFVLSRVSPSNEAVRRFYIPTSMNEIACQIDEPVFASIHYRPLCMEISLSTQSLSSIGVRISYTKDSFEVRHFPKKVRLGFPLARGLYHLGLLTPEVEAALKVTITAHQKLEWAREYEARYGL